MLKAITLIFFITALARMQFINPESPTIISVSTSLNEVIAPRGSFEGGTMIYIRGTNFSPNPGQNVITVGPYPCIIPADGSKQDTLSCMTTPPTDATKFSNLKVTVTVGSVFVGCNSNNCAFSYASSLTPFIDEIIPRSVVGGDSVYLYGSHKIQNLGDSLSNGNKDISYILIGDRICSLIDVIQDQDRYNPNSRSAIQCFADRTQVAGQYTFKQLVNFGFAKKSVRSFQTSYFTEKNYTQRILAKVSSLSSYQGGSKGQIIAVKGSGFSSNLADYSCKVAGQICQVFQASLTQVSVQIPPLSGNNTVYGALPKDSADNTIQQGMYLGSNGISYKRYSRGGYYKTASEWLTSFRGPVSLDIQEQRILTQLSSPQVYGQDYIEYVKGYFHAPRNGQYRFSVVADDDFIMVMSTVKNNANISNLQNLLVQQSSNTDHFISYTRTNVTQSVKNITLTTGYYYFELVLVNYDKQGFFKIFVDFPSLRQYTINPTWQIDRIIIKPSQFTAQIIKVKVMAASGSFNLFYYESGILRTMTINVGSSADIFRNRLDNLPNIAGYDPIVTLILLNGSGNPTSNSSLVQGYEYTITINKYRPPTSLPNSRIIVLVAGIVPASLTITRVTNHSPPLSGTFSIYANNIPIRLDSGGINFPYDLGASTLAYYLNKLYNTSEIQVSTVINTQYQTSNEKIIQYVGLTVPAYSLRIDTNLLTGGNEGTTPQGTVQILRYYSNRQLYSPIPYDFLYVASQTPTLQLTLNQIPVVCTNCSYVYKQAITPIINSATRQGRNYTILISYPSSNNIILSDITVTILQVNCLSLTGSIFNFTCSLPINSDSQVALPAGTGKPQVHINKLGFAINTAVLSQNIPITVTSFSLAQSSPGGGIQASLIGTGFPINSTDNLSIILCNNPVTQFITVSNQRIIFTIPPQSNSCSGSNNQITYNNKTATFTFAYNPSIAPQITAISLKSSSPILKSNINITGLNFNPGTTNVYLMQNGKKKYQLSIITINSTSIYCILGGGRSGNYDIIVQDSVNGQSIVHANAIFSYKIVITNLSLSIGHKGGGYNLTINGFNFATSAGTNNVFIGDAINSICKILSYNSTSIVCRVPRMMNDYTTGQPLNVVVTGRLIEQSVCQGNCSFTYVDSGASIIIVPNVTTFRFRDIVIVNGSGLTGAKVSVGGIVCNANVTNNLIRFIYPELTSNQYQVVIQVSNGWTYPQFISNTVLSIDSAATSNIPYTGIQLKINGNGFPASGIDAWFVCSSTKQLKILSANTTAIFVQIPNYFGQATCRVNITVGTTFKFFTVNYRTNVTCAGTISGSGLSYNFTRTNMTSTYIPDKIQFVWLDSAGNPTTSKYLMNVVNRTRISTSYLPAGIYQVSIHSSIYGFAAVTPPNIRINFTNNPTAVSVTSTFAGGKQLVLNGIGFVTNKPQNNQITICGLPSKIITANMTSVTIQTPPLVTTTTQSLYSLSQNSLLQGVAFGDQSFATYINDNSFNTIYSSSNPVCFVGINFGANTYADISQIRYVPNPIWIIASVKLNGAVFQGSNDGINYNKIFEIDTSQVHSGWNNWQTSSSVQYQYVRFKHNSTSGCQMAQIQVYGILYSRITVQSGVDITCDVIVKTQNKLIANAVTYSHATTSVVTSINPLFGPSTGGTIIRIYGSGFGTNPAVAVKIDGIDCSLINKTNTQIYCTTGVRANPPTTGNNFSVISNGNNAIIACQPYLYIDRWSKTDTWGGEAVPRQGDSVYVPKGMTLLVDQSTPILDTVIVQGKIQFEDVQSLTFDARYIVINNGQFQAGTQTRRFQNKLIITLYGGYNDKQLPILGNKVLGCRNCKFNMHGKQRAVTWTLVKSTISPGDIKFTVITPVDWVAGQKIAIAATSFDHYQTEQMEIQSVSTDGLQITVTKPFKYRHYADTQTFGSQNFVMRAEVGLLTRNIVVQGDPTSKDSQYGSHLMLTGKQENGLVGKISYAQFTHCGQPKIVGRYCTHFHMAGQVPDSYIRGISVHHSFARVLTIHGTHFLLVEKNVGYYVKGHSIFIQDGIQTKNIIQDNLMMSSITSTTLLQSDITVASYWITNPSNTVRRNHAAGGDFYGFWYEIKQHPDGPSASSDICPMGMQLGISQDNVAHSNRRFGLRIFKLSARKYPCITTMDQSLEDPYIDNPPILSVFQNYTLWKNQECGFLGQQLGYTTIRNSRTIDSRKAGLQFHKTNYTKQLVTAENILVVGYSSGNAPADINNEYNKARGVIASRTDGLKFSGIRFYNFGSTMTPLQSCSQCWNFKLWVTGGKTTLFQNISYSNIQGKYIFWQKWRRQIFIDLDGTLTRPFQTAITPAIPAQLKAVISPYRPSLMLPGKCYRVPNDLWDNSIFCDQTVTIRGILFTNWIPYNDIFAIDIKTNLMISPTENVILKPESNFSSQAMIAIKESNDIPFSWAMPFITNQYYNVHWKWGIDFTHISISPSRLWQSNEGVVLRFNYSDQRQLFQVGKWYKQQIQLPYIIPSPTIINPASCQNADYYHDLVNKYLYVCISGRNKTIREWIDVNGIRCLNYCPNTTTQRQSFTRMWSNATQWPNQTLPEANHNVTIPYQWNLVLDIDPPILRYVLINGILIFDKDRDNKFQAYNIWVKQGIIQIGNSTNSFTKKANIVLHGAKDDNYLVIDPDTSGNKMLAVTGGLEFYGIEPQTTWTKLIQTAFINATLIKVISAAGWSVGDEIVIAPSYAGRKQFQKLTITSINGNNVSFTPPLTYQHFGSATTTIQNVYGVLDTRAAVGLLTRNIQITPGPDRNNWGCRVLVYGYNQINQNITIPPVWRNGYAKLRGVQISGCGQYDTTFAALRIEKIGAQQNINNITTDIQNSAIHGCGGFCTFIKQSSNVNINNNVYFSARKFLVYVEEIISKYNFTNNLLVGACKRDQINNTNETHLVDDVAAYQQYYTINFTNNDVRVANNLAQGSEGQGFVFPATTCDLLYMYPFVNNTAGSCQVAFMFEKLDEKTCLAAKGCIGYASQIGLMANMPGTHTQVIYSDMFFADNERGVTLRYGNQIDDNTLIFRNSYITGISRPNCSNCYGPNKINYCSGGYAIRMFTATISGETFPLKKKATGHDVISSQESFDSKAFFNNVTFENYLYNNTLIPYCSNMAVFKRHDGAADAIASHYLTSTRCINCDIKSWAYFDKPNVAWRGWFGGCNELDCTGPNNYLIYDQDGNFTGQKSQLLSNNSMIGNNQQFCTFIPQINGHWCRTQKLAVLQYESIAYDFNKRKIWPVYLKYDGGSWNTTTNAWKEWQWNGGDPMNLRLGRFWSVIKLHQSYNLTYSLQAPSDSRFQIQKRLLPTGNSSDWAIIRIRYPVPNSIQVLVKNSRGRDILVKPYPILSGVSINLKTKTNECGANNFYFENGTIQFVINGINNCQVRVRLSPFIQLSTRLSIPIADFYTNNGLTSFITNICSFLNIDQGRLKIVEVRQGSTNASTIVNAIIQTTAPFIFNQSQPSLSNTTAQLADLNNLASTLSQGLKNQAINLIGKVLNYSTNTLVSYQCGDGVKAASQQCDNANKPGCINCQIQRGYYCTNNLNSLSTCNGMCGDGIRIATQQCDSGIKPGCSAICKIVPGYTCTGDIGSISNCSIRCGDGILGGSQKCDNGGNFGCSVNCVPDRGYNCINKIGLLSNCTSICGDNFKTPTQQCDNGKKIGCLNCTQPDNGYRCLTPFSSQAGSKCFTICGDGIRLPGQICDNENQPGCSTNCQIDIGYKCTGGLGVISTCSTTCGDSIKAGDQQCDNGNKTGCTNCKVDPGYQCILIQNGRNSQCTRI